MLDKAENTGYNVSIGSEQIYQSRIEKALKKLSWSLVSRDAAEDVRDLIEAMLAERDLRVR